VLCLESPDHIKEGGKQKSVHLVRKGFVCRTYPWEGRDRAKNGVKAEGLYVVKLSDVLE